MISSVLHDGIDQGEVARTGIVRRFKGDICIASLASSDKRVLVSRTNNDMAVSLPMCVCVFFFVQIGR